MSIPRQGSYRVGATDRRFLCEVRADRNALLEIAAVLINQVRERVQRVADPPAIHHRSQGSRYCACSDRLVLGFEFLDPLDRVAASFTAPSFAVASKEERKQPGALAFHCSYGSNTQLPLPQNDQQGDRFWGWLRATPPKILTSLDYQKRCFWENVSPASNMASFPVSLNSRGVTIGAMESNPPCKCNQWKTIHFLLGQTFR